MHFSLAILFLLNKHFISEYKVNPSYMCLLFLVFNVFSLANGEMRTLIRTTGVVYHMAVDISDPAKLLLADQSALKSFRHLVVTVLVGSDTQRGYQEGHSTAALFRDITGFVQLNSTSIVIADYNNSCLRMADMQSLETSSFAGKCEIAGFENGLDARYDHPYGVIKDSRTEEDYLLVADRYNHAVRRLNLVSGVTTTLLVTDYKGPTGLAYDSQSNLIITAKHLVGYHSIDQQRLTVVAGNNEESFADGEFVEARFSYPRELVVLSETFLIADEYTRRLRVVNLTSNLVTSICTGEDVTIDGLTTECGLNNPVSLLSYRNAILVGQQGAIRTLSGRH